MHIKQVSRQKGIEVQLLLTNADEWINVNQFLRKNASSFKIFSSRHFQFFYNINKCLLDLREKILEAAALDCFDLSDELVFGKGLVGGIEGGDWYETFALDGAYFIAVWCKDWFNDANDKLTGTATGIYWSWKDDFWGFLLRFNLG